MEEKKTKTELELAKAAASELEFQNQRLKATLEQYQTAMQEMNLTNAFKRLDYLFKVVETAHMFSDDFVDKCVAELEESLSKPEENTEE